MDKAWRGFVWATHDAAQDAFGKVPTGSAPKASTNPRVASLSTEQKNLHCRINAEPDPEQRKALKIERSAKLHEIRRILQKEGEQYWQRKAVEVDALRPDPRSYFNAINNLRQLRSGKKAAPVGLADADGRIMADISWNLNAFNEYYESVFYRLMASHSTSGSNRMRKIHSQSKKYGLQLSSRSLVVLSVLMVSVLML